MFFVRNWEIFQGRWWSGEYVHGFSCVGLLRGRLFMGASNSLRLKRQVLDVRHLNTSRSSRVQLVERWARNILMVRILPAKVLKLSAGKEIDCYSTNWNDPLFLDISWYFMIFLPNLQNNPATQPQPPPPPVGVFPAWVATLSRSDGDNTHQKVPTPQAAPRRFLSAWPFRGRWEGEFARLRQMVGGGGGWKAKWKGGNLGSCFL